MFSKQYQNIFYMFSIFIFLQLSFVLTTKAPDLCGAKKDFDLSPLHYGSPWRVSKSFLSATHLTDILLCQNFSSLKDYTHENCKNSFICQKITTHPSSNSTSDSKVNFIGYVPIGDPIKEYNTYRVRYAGPHCSENVNYTVDIRFTCGNNLGYPSYPLTYLTSNCSTILHWETSAACQGSSVSSFGLNERPCYVIDDKGNRRDLTPLIRPNSSYKVWSSDSRDFYVNICTDANDKCGGDSSACTRNEQGQLESTGSYKWSSIEFYSATQDNKYDHIKLAYKTKNSKCKDFASTLSESTTNIRFICPKDVHSYRSYPVLLSSLDCEHEIEWQTKFACPQEEITFRDDDCKIDDVDFNQLRFQKFYEFKNLTKADGTNISILLNVCGSVINEKCSKDSPVCIVKNEDYISLELNRKNAKFIKADNLISLVYSSGKASCNSHGNSKLDKAIIEFECDPNIPIGKPELITLDECSYSFKWRTQIVCPLLRSSLNCTFESDNQFQFDLSSLTLANEAYRVKRSEHDPKYYYKVPSKKQILINICGEVSRINKTIDCGSSSACLVDENSSISLGRFTQPLTLNKELNALQLLYTGGFDPQTNQSQSTLINFHCSPYIKDRQPHLVDYDQSSGQYTIEFNTPAACQLQTIQGSDCKVTDPFSNQVYDLKQLASEKYYSIKAEKYNFELNVCQPVHNGSCGENVAICQVESDGQQRKFSLGTANSLLSYWNTLLNMTFVGGTPYNDPNKTPRKSHISFLCDPNAGNGHPEFDGEKDRAYSFRWYTSLVCPGPVPKVTHCVFENETHFFDLSPLSLERGNHFELGKSGSIVYINFCRPLNQIRDDILRNCKANSGICLVENFNIGKPISLGEPVGHPFKGFDGGIYMLYNNGDTCKSNDSRPFTSRVRFECDKDLDEDLSITFIDPIEDPISDDNCNYEFIVRTPLACPRPLSDLNLEKCIYTDERTNLSADLNQLTLKTGDYSITGANGPNSAFRLNICKSVRPMDNQCKDSAVCFRSANNSLLSYGSAQHASIYFEGNNLHLRYQNGSACDAVLDKRPRSTDIEFICDPSAHSTKPTLYFQNNCLAKFQWKTSAVCNLVIPSCSLIDDSTGDYYSLRHLASMSHVWNVTSSSSSGEEHYLINVCKSLSSDHKCGPSSAACKCKINDSHQMECNTNIGKVSDHELSLDRDSKELILLYEDGDQICDGSYAQTHIRFRCSNQSGHSGPKFLNVTHCTHFFTWDTIFACSQRNIAGYSVELSLSKDFVVHDKLYDLRWDLGFLFNSSFNVSESERPSENYTYIFDFKDKITNKIGNCANSAICQTKPSGFTRDIGTINNWRFSFVGSDLFVILHSDDSVCGRNINKNVTSKIKFVCASSVGIGHPKFLFESQDCDYLFVWETSHVCDLTINRPMPAPSHSKSSGISPVWVVFSISLFALFGFAGWLFASNSSTRDDVVYRIRRVFRRNDAPQIPFRYQQLSL